MDNQITSLFKLPDIEKYEDVHLLTLSEYCATLEERVCAIAQTLPSEQRQIIEAYINARNDLEVESTKAALRWGKRNYR